MHTLPQLALASFRVGLAPDALVRQLEPTTFTRLINTGEGKAAYKIRPWGGSVFAQAKAQAFIAFERQRYGEALRYPAATYKSGEQWHMFQVLFGMHAAVRRSRGECWPEQVILTTVANVSDLGTYRAERCCPLTCLTPVCTTSHWALLVLRAPAHLRPDWDVALVDSMQPADAMLQQATLVLQRLATTFGFPVQKATVRCVPAPPQANDWECGPRVALHTEQALAAEPGQPLAREHFVRMDTSVLLAKLAADGDCLRRVLGTP
jgi:hypothetical protein